MVNRTSCRQGSVITKSPCHVESLCNCRLKHESESYTETFKQRKSRRNRKKKEKKKQKKAAEQQNSEPTVAVKAADMDPEQENHPEQTEVVPPPAKKLKRSQAVSYASADIEAFFQSATTTAPDVQNPGIKFVTVCHFKCI